VSEYLLVSTDGGSTWDEKLVCDGIDLSGELVILTDRGIFYTESHPTGTNSWQDFNDGISGTIDSVTYDATRDYYYAVDSRYSLLKATELGGTVGSSY